MDILIAPDSFKGSLSAEKYCDVAKKAVTNVFPNANVVTCPMADGGEGTVEALVYNTKGSILYETVTDPIGKPVKAKYGLLGDDKTAVIEMASASGLPLVPVDKKNPLYTTTYGTGELVKKVIDKGCTTIILGIGGSATNDGGAGMMEALGFKLLDEEGNMIQRGAIGLKDLHHIDTSNKDKRLDDVNFLVACDVNNPLCGPNGASYIYGPQKGATKEQLPLLDDALANFASIIKKDFGKEVKDIEGSGAAGGLGAGLLAFFDATLKPGFEIIKDIINLEKYFSDFKFDLVITGEGEINYQTVNGKLPVGVAKTAKKYDVPVIAVAGSIGKDAERVYEHGIDSVFTIMDGPHNLDYAIKNADILLFQAIERIMKVIKLYN
ncbi:glycerate kinase [Vallitalea guaymasensis]|uniref:glycerate kinase n=1 Tax=Vallitalea guaymasensis TaxID=1185412 RepID=UPI00272D1ED9|nr:glycerate kinase [Vallitalea guaymasensis]